MQYLGAAKLRDDQLPLLVGLPVEVHQPPTSASVELLRAVLPSPERTEGRLTAVSPDSDMLTLQTRAGAQTLTRVLGTDVTASGEELPVGALEVGDRVQVTQVLLPSGARIALELAALNLRLQTTTSRLKEINLESNSFTLVKQLRYFTVAEGALLAASWQEDLYAATTLAELATYLPQFRRIDVRVAYLTRGRNRIATRVVADATGLTPPSPQ